MSFASMIGETVEQTAARAAAARPNQEKVRHFHRLHGYLVSDVPTVPSYQDRVVRDRLLYEEFTELADELHKSRPDINAIAHEAADLMYVLYGLAVECGFNLDDVFTEVHRANLTKSRHPEGGKAVKGERFIEADVKGVLDRG
jgi:predicted HAD superfamily Cof-like phosphohydrolase